MGVLGRDSGIVFHCLLHGLISKLSISKTMTREYNQLCYLSYCWNESGFLFPKGVSAD